MNNECGCGDPKAWAVALGRWCLGMILLFSGLAKLPDVGGFSQDLVGQFAKTWLPGWLVGTHGYAIPFIEVMLGALLILGLWRNSVLILSGLFLFTLTFGMVIARQPGIVFNNFGFTIAAAALLFLGEFDRFAIGGRKP